MKNQSLFVRFAGSLSLMVMLSACGKNISLGVPADQLAKTQDQSKAKEEAKKGASTDGNADANSTATDASKGASDASKTSGSETASNSSAVLASMDDIGVLNPLSVADVARLNDELKVHFTRNSDDEEERKTARVIFKVLPYQVLESKVEESMVPVLFSSGKKKGKQKVDPVTKKPMVQVEQKSTSGTLEMVLTLVEKDHAYDSKNFKICLLADNGESDRCVTYSQLKEKGAILNNPIVDSELKIDLMTAFGMGIESVFEITDEVNLASGEESKYFRKLHLSFNGVKTAVGAKLEVSSEKRADASVDADYNAAILENIAPNELTPSVIQ
jgi:hypothetical protein